MTFYQSAGRFVPLRGRMKAFDWIYSDPHYWKLDICLWMLSGRLRETFLERTCAWGEWSLCVLSDWDLRRGRRYSAGGNEWWQQWNVVGIGHGGRKKMEGNEEKARGKEDEREEIWRKSDWISKRRWRGRKMGMEKKENMIGKWKQEKGEERIVCITQN